jgi:hypothetical protein
MNQPTHTSAAMSEIVRVAWWSLRALGCPVGAIEAMSRVLAYSEALDGKTLAALRRHEAALLVAFAGGPPRFDAMDAETGIVDASGRSMLDIGPRVVDLLGGLAKRRDGAVRVTVKHLADTIGLAGAATVAAQRKLGLVLIGDDARRAWQFYSATQDGEITALAGELNGASVDDLMANLRDLAGGSFPVTTPPIDAIDHDARTLDVIAFPFVATDDFAARASRRADIHCKNVSRVLKDAYAHGIDVAPEDFRFLYELETRTWAPSSERSRMQAGFHVASPAA